MATWDNEQRRQYTKEPNNITYHIASYIVMDNNSQEALRRVTQNDPLLKRLRIGRINDFGVNDGNFYPDNSDDYSTLGSAIANNTHLRSLEIRSSNDLPLGVTNRGFYDGLKTNSFIHELTL